MFQQVNREGFESNSAHIPRKIDPRTRRKNKNKKNLRRNFEIRYQTGAIFSEKKNPVTPKWRLCVMPSNQEVDEALQIFFCFFGVFHPTCGCCMGKLKLGQGRQNSTWFWKTWIATG